MAKGFISFRRHYLDEALAATRFAGKVLDVGGKKENKRGRFRPPLSQVESWKYLNIDADTKPDYLCGITQVPVENGAFDMLLFSEVLEHLGEPEAALMEMSRILRTGGSLVATIPFLYPVHGDPSDYQRWTPEKIRAEFGKAGLVIEKLEPMGGLYGVIFDLIRSYLSMTGRFGRKAQAISGLCVPALTALDRNAAMKTKLTTGFYILARKEGPG